VARLRAAITSADALLFVTPEYNSSVPGALKNAVDWASRPAGASPLRNKPVAVIGASTGMFGAVWAQAELRKVLGATGARVLDVELAA
jgi:chromate reductase